MKQILINTKLDEAAIRGFQSDTGYRIDIPLRIHTNESLLAIIHKYHAIIISSTNRITEEFYKRGTRLEVIIRAGSGLDNIDLTAAHRHGISILNANKSNCISTAEHTFALILSLARKISQAHESLREGKWQRQQFQGIEVYGKTLGILGFGRIGKEVHKRAQAFGMHSIITDPHITTKQARQHKTRLVSLEELCRGSDVLSLHLPLNESTRRILRLEHFEIMKRTALFINCARGGLYDEKDLITALEEGFIAGAALDVFSEEPPSPALTKLFQNPQVLCSPHIAALTKEAKTALTKETLNLTRRYFQRHKGENPGIRQEQHPQSESRTKRTNKG